MLAQAPFSSLLQQCPTDLTVQRGECSAQRGSGAGLRRLGTAAAETQTLYPTPGRCLPRAFAGRRAPELALREQNTTKYFSAKLAGGNMPSKRYSPVRYSFSFCPALYIPCFVAIALTQCVTLLRARTVSLCSAEPPARVQPSLQASGLGEGVRRGLCLKGRCH